MILFLFCEITNNQWIRAREMLFRSDLTLWEVQGPVLRSRVQYALDLFGLLGSTKLSKSDPAKQSHKAGYQLGKLTQVFLIYTSAFK